jgi:hypothetical protein
MQAGYEAVAVVVRASFPPRGIRARTDRGQPERTEKQDARYRWCGVVDANEMTMPYKASSSGSPKDLVAAIVAGDVSALQRFQDRMLPRMRRLVAALNRPQALTDAQVLRLASRSLQASVEAMPRMVAVGSPVLRDDVVFDLWALSFATRVANLDRSLETAARRQRPKVLACRGFHIDVAFLPSALVLCGDVVAFDRPQPSAVAIMLADAVHHGPVPAMETSAIVQEFRNASAGSSPQQILGRMYQQAATFFDGRPCPTALVAVLDAKTRQVAVANAGTPSCGWWVPRAGAVAALRLRGNLLGCPPDPPEFEAVSYPMEPGDQLVLATDGLASLPGTRPGGDGLPPLGPELPAFLELNRGPALHARLETLARERREADLDPDDVTFVTVTGAP